MNDLIKRLEAIEPKSNRKRGDLNRASTGLVKLSGTINNYTVERGYASFVFTDSDRTAMGVIAIAAVAAGLGGQAVSTAANAGDTEEEADLVGFYVDDKICMGWLWRSPFKDGDVVDVAAEWRDDHYEIYGVARPSDQMVALYPHCSRGRVKHVKNAIKWWFYI